MTSVDIFSAPDKWKASSDLLVNFAEDLRSAVWVDIPQSDFKVLKLISMFPTSRYQSDVDATKSSKKYWILLRPEVKVIWNSV